MNTQNNGTKKIKVIAGCFIVFLFIVLISIFSNQNFIQSNKLSEKVADFLTNKIFTEYKGTYIKLTRKGNTFTSYASNNGKEWKIIGEPQNINADNSVYVGMFATSHKKDILGSAEIDNVEIQLANGEIINGGWSESDVGNVKIPGSMTNTGGVYNIKGSFGGLNEFHYVYRQIAGDWTIKARVLSVEDYDMWSKAGLLMIKDLNIRSDYAQIVLTPKKWISFIWKSKDNTQFLVKMKTEIGADFNHIVRKALHFLEFMVLGFLLYIPLSMSNMSNKKKVSIIFILSLVFSCLDEIHQVFVKGRTPLISDIFIDMLGVILALIILMISNRIFSKSKRIQI